MDEGSLKHAVSRARQLEKSGSHDEAIRAYLLAGAVEDAARLLVLGQRYLEAAQVLMQSLGVPAADVGRLDEAGRRVALKAAVCFARAHRNEPSVELFLALGEPLRAAEVLERAGDRVAAARLRSTPARPGEPARPKPEAPIPQPGRVTLDAARKLEEGGRFDLALQAYLQLKRPADAARMARALSRPADAAQLFGEAGLFYDAGVSHSEAGDASSALAALLHVTTSDPRYRAACVQAIRTARTLGELSFELDHFLKDFTASGPVDDRELDAFYLLGQLYGENDLPENACDAWEKLLWRSPGYRDAEQRLRALTEAARGKSRDFAAILNDDASFRGQAGRPQPKPLPSLPSLPSLPDLPPLASDRAAPMGSATWTADAIPAVPEPTAAPHLEPALLNALPAGYVVAGRYRVERILGQGGMAVVYAATDLELGEEIALKLFVSRSEDPTLISRFKQELAVCRKLSHPNIVRLYDIGTHEGHRFITMELLAGRDLGSMMDGPLEIGRAARYLMQACDGLQLAHDEGVVHRDIKPENFFITAGDVLKVMDFGIAKRESTPGKLTVAGFIAGTPAYMSPEQINNFASVTFRSDLYSLGVVAYEMLTGTLPFWHEELTGLLGMHITKAPEPLRKRNPAMPVALEALVLRLLEKQPDRRFASCRELKEALGAAVAPLAAAPAVGVMRRPVPRR